MRPYIIRDIELDTDRMVLEVTTNHGVYEYPILPALDYQEASNIIRYERGMRVIRSKEYHILKNADTTSKEFIIAKIRVYHEPTHDDIRVICPIHSTAKFLRKCRFKKVIDNNTILNKLYNFIYKIDNLFEDNLSVGILTQLGFPKKTVITALRIEDTWKSISKSSVELSKLATELVLSKLPRLKKGWFIKYIPHSRLKDIVTSEITKVKPEEIWNQITQMKVDMSDYVFLDVTERLLEIWKAYDDFDEAYIKLLGDLGIKIDREKQIKWVKEQIKYSVDPFIKLRWILEYQRLTNRELNLNKAIKIAFMKS